MFKFSCAMLVILGAKRLAANFRSVSILSTYLQRLTSQIEYVGCALLRPKPYRVGTYFLIPIRELRVAPIGSKTLGYCVCLCLVLTWCSCAPHVTGMLKACRGSAWP